MRTAADLLGRLPFRGRLTAAFAGVIIVLFGGLALLLDGNMACGVMGDDVLIRIDPASHDRVLAEPGTREFAMTSRPAKGWILVGPDATGTDEDLRRWVDRGVGYARSLPPKPGR
jgi:hypothetical protein